MVKAHDDALRVVREEQAAAISEGEALAAAKVAEAEESVALERAAAKIQGQFRRGRAQQDMKALVKAHHGRLTHSLSQAAAEAKRVYSEIEAILNRQELIKKPRPHRY